MNVYAAGAIAGLISFVAGGIWFNLLFKQPYLAGMKKVGAKPPSGTGGGGPVIALNLLLNLAAGVGVAALYELAAVSGTDYETGILVGLLTGVLAIIPLKLQAIYLRLPRGISFVTYGYWLLSFLIYGVVAAWLVR